jgi:hypothetical protein
MPNYIKHIYSLHKLSNQQISTISGAAQITSKPNNEYNPETVPSIFHLHNMFRHFPIINITERRKVNEKKM